MSRGRDIRPGGGPEGPLTVLLFEFAIHDEFDLILAGVLVIIKGRPKQLIPIYSTFTSITPGADDMPPTARTTSKPKGRPPEKNTNKTAINRESKVAISTETPETPTPSDFYRAAEAMKVGSDATRLHILSLIRDEPLDASSIAAAVGMTYPAIHYQLKNLRRRGLILTQKTGEQSIDCHQTTAAGRKVLDAVMSLLG